MKKLKYNLLICLLFLSTILSAQTRIQTATGNTGTIANTSIAVTLTSSPTTGNTLIAVISTRSNTTNNVTSITQTGATWTRAISSTGNATNNTTTEIWYTTALSGAATAITITQGSARSAVVVMEYNGLAYGAPLDQVASNFNTTTSTSASTGTTATTTSTDGLWIGGIGLRSSSYSLTAITNLFLSVTSAASTNATTTNNAKIYALEKVVTTTGTAATGGTVSTKSYWSGAVAAFKVAVVSSFTPISACKGSSQVVTINGEGFTGSSVVDFNGTAATTTYVSSTQITAVLPANATPGFIHVTTGPTVLESKKPFLIKAPVVPTANITNTTCPTSIDGAVSPNNIPIAVNFDNTKSQYINLGTPLLNNLSAFTLEGWIKTTTFNRNSFFGQNNAVEIGLTTGGLVELWSEGLNTNIYSPTAYPTDGLWHHIAGTGDGTTMKIYIDGELIASGTHAALPATILYGSSPDNTMIGGYVWDAVTPNYHNGQVLKAGYWNRALTNTEIASLASTPHQYYTGETNLIAGYNFFEGTGTTLSKTPTGTNGTFTGTPISTWSDLFTYSWTKTTGSFSASTKNISSLPVATYNLAATFNGCTANSGDFAVISNGTESTAAASISGVSRVCPNTEVVLTLNGGTLGTGATWKWYENACGTNEITTGLNTGKDVLTLIPTVTTTYYARAEGTCNTTACVSKTVTVNATGEWLGTTSTDWNTDANWCGSVPTSTSDVIIPTSPFGSRFPLVGSAGAVCKSLTIANGASVTMDGAYSFNVHGNFVNNGTFTPAISTVTFMENGSVSGTSTTTFHNLTIHTGKTLTAPIGNVNITGNWTNNGTFADNSGTIIFNGSSAQTTTGTTTFKNLTITNSTGVTANNNITVNGILNLNATNPSATKGLLEMTVSYSNYPGTTISQYLNSNRLIMGANATTIGIGDVTGTVRRNTIVAETPYTFGHQYTTISLTPGTMPDSLCVSITIGNSPENTKITDDIIDGAVQRTYEIIPAANASNCYVTANFHYLNSELTSSNNSYVNTEQKLTTMDYDIQGGYERSDEHGRANYDYTNKYIGLSSVPISYFIQIPSTHEWRTIFALRNYTENYITWNGSVSTNWNDPLNWTLSQGGAAIPTSLSHVIIPNTTTTTYDPSLPTGNTTINTMSIENGGILTMSSQTITIQNSFSGGWEDQNTTGNDPGTSTVIFTTPRTTISGNARFYNAEIADGSDVTIQEASNIKIENSFIETGTGKLFADIYDNTVTYNKSGDQTIVHPDGTNGYHNLVLSGSGTKTFQAISFSITGNLTLDAAISTTGNTIVMSGPASQTISGTTSATFNNLTINNAAGVTIGNNETVNGTLTLTNGLLSTGNNTITVNCVGSITGQSSLSYVNGKLAREYCSASSKVYPIGKGGVYRPLTLEYTTLSATSTITAEQFETVIPGTSFPNYTTYQTERYWNLTETAGGGDGNYILTLNGSPFPTTATTASAGILRGDGTTNSLKTATFSSPDFTSTALTDNAFGNFAVASECLPPTIDTHPSASSSCELNGTPQFSVGVTGTYTYQWQESTTGTGGTFATISDGGVYSNATTATLTITNPTFSMNGYAYRAVVTRDCGGTTTSNSALLTVNPQPQGSLAANSICKGETGYLTWTATAGTGPFTVIYNDGTEHTQNNVVSGTPFTVGAHSASKTYTLVSVANAACTRETGFTQGSATVSVNPYITWTGATSRDWQTATNWCGGVPTTTDNVLIPALPSNQPLISSTGTGYVHSIIIENGASVTVEGANTFDVSGNITNAGTISMGIGTLTIAGGTIVENVGLIETQNTSAQPLPVSANYGNSGTIRFNSAVAAQTLFAGTYNDVVVDNPQGVTMAANANVVANGTLEIKSGSKLEIGTGRSVNANTVINNAGNEGIRLKSEVGQPSGTLIFNNSESTPVQATVEMYSKASWDKTQPTNYQYKWQFMGIPVQSLDVLPTFYGGYVRRYNEAGNGAGFLETNRWIQLQEGAIMEALDCYEVVQLTPKKYEFPGMLYNQSIQKTLTYTVGADYPGQHIIGNPYTAAIDIKQIQFGANTDSTVYLYNTGTFASWFSYKQSLSPDSTAFTPGQYTAIPVKTAGSSLIPRQIPSMQAFMVRSKSSAGGSITVNYNAVKQKNFSVQRSKQEALSSMRINLIGATADQDVMWIFSQEGTTRGYDNGWDAPKLVGDAGTARIQSVEADNTFQINTVPDINETVISARAGRTDKFYKLIITTENMMSKYNSLYLLDINTNKMVDISVSGTEYLFEMTNTSSVPRFKILTSAGMTTGLINKYVNYSNGKLNCTDWSKLSDVKIFSIQGIEVSNLNISNLRSNAIDIGLSQGIYILTTTTKDNIQESTKIIVE